MYVVEGVVIEGNGQIRKGENQILLLGVLACLVISLLMTCSISMDCAALSRPLGVESRGGRGAG